MGVSDPQDVNAARVRVWDAPVRLFHWAIVLLIVTSWIAADQGYMRVHLWSGSAMLALLLFRITWGIVGSSTARFGDFVRSPRAAFRYLYSLGRGEKPLHAGHNPAGGWMVVAFLALLTAQVTTGLFSNDGLKFMGPLALLVSADTSDRITSLHGTIFYCLLASIWLHLVAVFFYLLVRRENLVGAMLTGSKPRHLVPEGAAPRFTRAWLAWAILAICAGIAGWVVRSQ